MKRMIWVLSSVVVAQGVTPARADVALPPTLVMDWAPLAFPYNLLAAIALLGCTSIAFFMLRRAGVRKWVLVLLCVAIFMAGNIAIYALAPRPVRNRPFPRPPSPPIEQQSEPS